MSVGELTKYLSTAQGQNTTTNCLFLLIKYTQYSTVQHTHPVEVGVWVLWHVVVEDNVDPLNVDSPAKEVSGAQDALAEGLEGLVLWQPVQRHIGNLRWCHQSLFEIMVSAISHGLSRDKSTKGIHTHTLWRTGNCTHHKVNSPTYAQVSYKKLISMPLSVACPASIPTAAFTLTPTNVLNHFVKRTLPSCSNFGLTKWLMHCPYP